MKIDHCHGKMFILTREVLIGTVEMKALVCHAENGEVKAVATLFRWSDITGNRIGANDGEGCEI